jgi:hypothetical protein
VHPTKADVLTSTRWPVNDAGLACNTYRPRAMHNRITLPRGQQAHLPLEEVTEPAPATTAGKSASTGDRPDAWRCGPTRLRRIQLELLDEYTSKANSCASDIR